MPAKLFEELSAEFRRLMEALREDVRNPQHEQQQQPPGGSGTRTSSSSSGEQGRLSQSPWQSLAGTSLVRVRIRVKGGPPLKHKRRRTQ